MERLVEAKRRGELLCQPTYVIVFPFGGRVLCGRILENIYIPIHIHIYIYIYIYIHVYIYIYIHI